jgi:hypothetical protein
VQRRTSAEQHRRQGLPLDLDLHVQPARPQDGRVDEVLVAQLLVAINSRSTKTELDEQKGFANLCKGLFGMFRNPTAHDPRIERTIVDEELLGTLTAISLVHRRLDAASAVRHG